MLIFQRSSHSSMLLFSVLGKLKVDRQRTRFSVSQGDATLVSPFHSSVILVSAFVGPNESCNSSFEETVFLRESLTCMRLCRQLRDQHVDGFKGVTVCGKVYGCHLLPNVSSTLGNSEDRKMCWQSLWSRCLFFPERRETWQKQSCEHKAIVLFLHIDPGLVSHPRVRTNVYRRRSSTKTRSWSLIGGKLEEEAEGGLGFTAQASFIMCGTTHHHTLKSQLNCFSEVHFSYFNDVWMSFALTRFHIFNIS